MPNRLARELLSSALHGLVPALIHFLTASSESRRRESLACLNSFVFPMPGRSWRT